MRVSSIKSFSSRQKVTQCFILKLREERFYAFYSYSSRLDGQTRTETLLDNGYYRNRGWRSRTNDEEEKK